jgi:hypothetical protein
MQTAQLILCIKVFAVSKSLKPSNVLIKLSIKTFASAEETPAKSRAKLSLRILGSAAQALW